MSKRHSKVCTNDNCISFTVFIFVLINLKNSDNQLHKIAAETGVVRVQSRFTAISFDDYLKRP